MELSPTKKREVLYSEWSHESPEKGVKCHPLKDELQAEAKALQEMINATVTV